MHSNTEASDFANRIADLFVVHEEVQRIWDRFDSLRLHLRTGKKHDPKHLLLTGISGAGKSQIGFRYKENNPGYTLVEDKKKIDIRPVLYIKLPFPFTIQAFYKKILSALGTKIFRSDLRIDFLKDQALHLLRQQRTELIIFDELNFLTRTKRIDDQEGMEIFKDLSNEGVSFVFMGTPKVEYLLGLEDEYFRRFTLVRLKAFDECDERFCSLLENIEKQIQPPYKLKLGDKKYGKPQLLHEYCEGRIAYLHSIIVEAYRLLKVFDKDFHDISQAKLTVKTLREAKESLFGKQPEKA
ncbi:TniB family NTP-binding protein [Paenibacillus glycanilyticus]|uniref:AAA+ ATPase domain-containing protein n=1 Tax=Paenibacillus glycanilyticus TaxID=126569 RepID=A0ABQ6GKQ9_9BACL|nr:TniB family NTP-binding protein [Paenibacillus glycanilyticus]GLX71428.1 hypothetical protein MU1_57780 [Paenibacillus glycanilyticus]